MQKPVNDTGFAFPGGHVEFGETNTETLIREFREELGADIKVNGLKWVGEIFFRWDDKPCHQICLYYDIELKYGNRIPVESSFVGDEHLEGRDFNMEFHWIPLDRLDEIEVYPKNTPELMKNFNSGVRHFIYKEE